MLQYDVAVIGSGAAGLSAALVLSRACRKVLVVDADSAGRTSVLGVWAAGNVVDPRAQVITPAGGGSAAAIAINADLVEEDARNAARDFDQSPSTHLGD